MYMYELVCVVYVIVFFFKQKTAYEMRISDWSSDVCSSDLFREHHFHAGALLDRQLHRGIVRPIRIERTGRINRIHPRRPGQTAERQCRETKARYLMPPGHSAPRPAHCTSFWCRAFLPPPPLRSRLRSYLLPPHPLFL